MSADTADPCYTSGDTPGNSAISGHSFADSLFGGLRWILYAQCLLCRLIPRTGCHAAASELPEPGIEALVIAGSACRDRSPPRTQKSRTGRPGVRPSAPSKPTAVRPRRQRSEQSAALPRYTTTGAYGRASHLVQVCDGFRRCDVMQRLRKPSGSRGAISWTPAACWEAAIAREDYACPVGSR